MELCTWLTLNVRATCSRPSRSPAKEGGRRCQACSTAKPRRITIVLSPATIKLSNTLTSGQNCSAHNHAPSTPANGCCWPPSSGNFGPRFKTRAGFQPIFIFMFNSFELSVDVDVGAGAGGVVDGDAVPLRLPLAVFVAAVKLLSLLFAVYPE